MSVYTKTKNPASGNSTISGYDYEDSFRVGIKEGCENIIIDYLTNLYANPKKAVVRELLTNALDASVGSDEAVVVEIDCTDNGDNIFSITDFGVGMNAEQLKENYITYANSSKKDDFGVVGGFGLGSKSPMAISAQYTVTSCDGKEVNKAVVTRTEKGIFGKIEKIGDSTLSYTKVEIEVNSRTAEEMLEYAQWFAFFSNREIKTIDHGSENKGFKKVSIPFTNVDSYDISLVYDSLREKQETVVSCVGGAAKGKIPNCVVRIGDISYPLRDEANYREVYFVIDVEPGYFQFAPSREELPAGDKLEHIKEIVSKVRLNQDELFEFINNNFDIVGDEEVNRVAYKLFSDCPEYVEKIVGKEAADVVNKLNNIMTDMELLGLLKKVFGDAAVFTKSGNKVEEVSFTSVLKENQRFSYAVKNVYDIVVAGENEIEFKSLNAIRIETKSTQLVTGVDMDKLRKGVFPNNFRKSDVANACKSGRMKKVDVIYTEKTIDELVENPFFSFFAGILCSSMEYR